MSTAADRRSRSNHNETGNSTDRRRRRSWIMTTFRADVDLAHTRDRFVSLGEGLPCVRCYRCGELMTETELTIDRIIPGHKGGRYVRGNIRPACGPCNFGWRRTIGRWADE